MKKRILSLLLAFVFLASSTITAPLLLGVFANEGGGDNTSGATTTGGGSTEDTDGISVSKSVTYTYDYIDGEETNGIDPDSYAYTLNLDVFTTGVVSEQTTTVTPTDIVLVLDQSTSMMWPASQDANSADGGGTSLLNNVGIIDGYYELNADGSYKINADGSLNWIYAYEDDTTYTATYSGNSMDTVTVSPYSGNGSSITLTADTTTNWGTTQIETYGYLYSQSRQKDVIEAVVAFLYTLDESGADHRVSIVTYHNVAITVSALDSDYTALINTVLGWVTTANASNNNGYADGNANSEYTFNLQHSTNISYGVELAEDILAIAKYGTTNYNNTTPLTSDYTDGRQQLAVIFTDGIPTQTPASGTTSTTTSTTYNVNRALAAAQSMKQDGVTIFTVGMLNDVFSDHSVAGGYSTNSTSRYYADGTSGGGNSTTYTITKSENYISAFLDLLSSNYVNASSYITDEFPNSSTIIEDNTTYTITTTYNKATTTDDDNNTVYTEYYFPIDTTTSGDIAGELASIFGTVTSALSSSATLELDQTTQVRDVMTTEFYIPIHFESVADGSGDYDFDEDSQTYHYVGTGGAWQSDVDIDLYIAYCLGADSTAVTTGDAAVDEHDSEYYLWSDPALLYNTDTGLTGETNDDVSVIVRNVYVTGEDDTAVYYYDEVTATSDGNGGYTYKLTADGTTLYQSQQVIVEGFNFNNYYVTTTSKNGETGDEADYGAKLMISFEIKPYQVSLGSNDGSADNNSTLGGNDIETNTAASGVYIYNNLHTDADAFGYYMLEAFPVPEADIPITANLTVNDQTIYLGNSISVVDLVQIDGHTIDGEANAYVSIAYTLYATEAYTGTAEEGAQAVTDYETYLAGYTGDAADFDYSQFVIYDVETGAYFQYDLDDNNDRIPLYSVTINPGNSAYDATSGNYTTDTLITPEYDTDYIVEVTITPESTGTVSEVAVSSELFRVYVLYPSIAVNSVWVDYATPVNLREDNIIQTVDTDGGDSYQSFDSVRVSWTTTSTSDAANIPEPNQATPPTVIFGYTNERGIEFTAAEYEDTQTFEDAEFYISSMTVTSSDGYGKITRFDFTGDDYADTQYERSEFGVYVNRFDLEISKTVDADTYDLYPQSFVFDISYVGVEYETRQKRITDANDYAVFSQSDTTTGDNYIHLYVDSSGYTTNGNDGFYTVYSNSSDGTNINYGDNYTSNDVTMSFFSGDATSGYTLNTSGTIGDGTSCWIDFSDFTIYYYGVAYQSTMLWQDDGVTPLYEVESITEVDKTVEVVIDPAMSNVETLEWTDGGGNRYYTFNVIVADLYCGIEFTITEETDWSWRYEAGFTTNATSKYVDANSIELDYDHVTSTTPGKTENSTNTVYTDVYNVDLDGDGTADTTYTITNTVYTAADGEYVVGDVVTVTTIDGDEVARTTSHMSGDASTGITEVTTTEISAYKIVDFDEEIAARNESTVTALGTGLLGTYQNDDDADTDYLPYAYAYYLTPYTFDSVSTVSTSTDGTSATILVRNSEDYLAIGTVGDYSTYTRLTEEVDYYVYDTTTETWVTTSTTLIPKTVSAVSFDESILMVALEVYNDLENEYWLSYAALAENVYTELTDPRTTS